MRHFQLQKIGRVQWDENGKPVERSRDLKVHAGDHINLTIDK